MKEEFTEIIATCNETFKATEPSYLKKGGELYPQSDDKDALPNVKKGDLLKLYRAFKKD